MYIIQLYRSFDQMIACGKWEYHAERLLNIRCRDPAKPDTELKSYRVSNEVADAQLLTDYLVVSQKRKSRGRCKSLYLCH